MKRLFTLSFLLLLPVLASANTLISSTMEFEGTLTDNGDGSFSGVIPMIDEGAPDSGFDIYAEEGANAWFGNDPGSGPVWTSQLIGADHDAWPSWDPDTPDWYQYSLNFYMDGADQKWALRNHPGATEGNPWDDEAFWGAGGVPPAGVPMSGLMNWPLHFAKESDFGAYLPGAGTAEIPGGAAGQGGGEQAWDMDWSWGSEVVPLEMEGFDVRIEPVRNGEFHVTLTPNVPPATELAVLPASSGPINCDQSAILNFHYTPDVSTPALRGYEITVACSGELSFDAGDITDLDALSDIGMQSFYITDNGDDTYTVSAALLGITGGLTVEDDLFSVEFHADADGTGAAQILDYKLRDLDNGTFYATVSNAEVLVDCIGPNDPTLDAEPAFTIGTQNTLDWSDESATGAVLYYLERAQDAGFTLDVQNSGWIALQTHTFMGLSDDTEYFYRVKAKDALDNESGWSNVESSTQDDNLPSSAAGPLDAYQTAHTFDVPYTADDLTSGVDFVELYYQLNGGAWNNAGGTYTSSPISFSAGGDGGYCFFTVATDNVGNVELNPPTGDVCTIVDATAPAGTFVINNDEAYTTAVNVTLNNGISDANGPLEMRFSNDNTTWSGWVAYAATYAWVLDPPDGTKTVYAQFKDDAGLIFSPTDDIVLDTEPPGAAEGLSGLAGHEKTELEWTDPGDGDLALIEVWRGPWHDGSNVSAYPEYDDLGSDAIPTRPLDRAAAHASLEWDLAGTALPDDQVFTDNFAPRGIYYYELFAQDAAGNYGPPMDGNTRVMNYWLGDIRPGGYDGLVDVDDITALGTSFGTADGDGSYDNEIDVGPTDDWSRLGIPLTDNLLDFEDLMIFAMNYDVVSPRPVFGDALTYAALSWFQIDELTWALGLLDACSDLKALTLRAVLPEGVEIDLETCSVLEQQGGVPIFLRNIDRNGLDVNMAVMGTDAILQGEGELFRVKLDTPVDLTQISVEARGSGNQPLEFELEATEIPALPTAYAMSRNYPNPFNPKTTIRFDLPEAQSVRLMVYDITGRRIITLVEEYLQPGFHSVVWDGRDDRGSEIASGVYFYRIDAGPLSQTERMVLLK